MLAGILVGLFAALSVFGLVAPFSYATTPVSVTYYFANETCYNYYGLSYSSHTGYGGCGFPGATGGSLVCDDDYGNPIYGQLSTTTEVAANFLTASGFVCTTSVMQGTYVGPSFVVTSVDYSISACDQFQSDPILPQYSEVSVTGPVGGFTDPLPDCSVTTTVDQSVVPSAGTQTNKWRGIAIHSIYLRNSTTPRLHC